MGKLDPLRAQKDNFDSFRSSYVFGSARNKFSMLENPYIDTKIASVGNIEPEILKIYEKGGSGR